MKLLLLLSVLLTNLAFANERIISEQQAFMEGYVEKAMDASLMSTQNLEFPWEKNSLNWPVASANPDDPVGNDMVQFQDYGAPYYHGGQDIVSRLQETVYAPVTGVLEGGHYSYTEGEDGSLKKFWKPWPAQGDRLYFELSIVTAEGYRFEMHHVDPQNLTEATIQALNQGGVSVMAGAELGKVVPWPVGEYHHIHYNIVQPDGVIRLNGEYFSIEKPDMEPPRLLGVYAYVPNKTSKQLIAGKSVSSQAQELVVHTFDHRRAGGYQHPPARVQLIYSEKGAQKAVGWDFRQRLVTESGAWPHIWSFYMRTLSTERGFLRTWGDYGHGEFLIRLPLNAVRGEFFIELEDMNGQITRSDKFFR